MAAVVGTILANVAAGALSKALGFGQGGYIEKNGLFARSGARLVES